MEIYIATLVTVSLVSGVFLGYGGPELLANIRKRLKF